ncbi:MAG: Gfo/Idh/MocA family oxidoreductase [Bryobacteraceae bacterium]|nr:Gfo/Idh/MocA family oxidoreductase [Bryobacteraceae bacterium]
MNRRTFLISSALAAETAAFAQTATDRIATAIIGVGGRGSYLLRGVLAQPDARVLAVCDLKPDRLDKAATAAARDNAKTFTDYRKVLDLNEVEAVYIATPPHLHAEMAIAALKAGKHVYCEKPIGITAKQVRDLMREAKASKKVFQAGQQLRSVKMYQEAVAKIREGAIGDVIWMKAQRHATADLPYDGSSGDWYYDVSKSGGYLIEQSVHNLDLANWAIDAHPVKANGQGSIVLHKNEPAGRTIFDSGSITYEYPGGVLMSFTQMVFHPRMLPGGGQYIYVYGTKGAVDLMGGVTMYPLDPKGQSSQLVTKQTEDEHAHITAFFNCVRKGTASPSGIEIGATAALTAILGHEAMTTGKTVDWKDFGIDL